MGIHLPWLCYVRRRPANASRNETASIARSYMYDEHDGMALTDITDIEFYPVGSTQSLNDF